MLLLVWMIDDEGICVDSFVITGMIHFERDAVCAFVENREGVK